jgi:predicted ArsR family transcriptional regulator
MSRKSPPLSFERVKLTKTTARNEPALTDLRKLLRGGAFWTASEIAIEMDCSKMVAYLRLQALVDRGALESKMMRVGITGPEAKGYRIRRKKRPAMKCGKR